MREGWEYKKLGDVASYINGYAFKPKQWKEHGTPIIRIQNLNNPKAPFNYFDGEVPEKVKVQEGDLLISWSASLGTYIWHGDNAFLNQHIFKVVFDKTDIDKLFLKYAVASKLEEMVGQVHGATMKHIVKKDFDNTRIPVPSKSIQLEIVSELDKINEIIDLKKTQLKDLDLLAQSIFYDMFGDPIENPKGWEVKKLGEIASFKNGLNFAKNENGVVYKFLGVSDFKLNNEISSKELSTISLDSELNKDYLLKDNDIVFVRSNGSKELVGRCVLVKVNEETTYSGFCIRCRIIYDEIIPTYLLTVLKSNGMRAYLTQSGQGCNISNLNQKILAKADIPLPPLSLQQSFAEKMQAIESQKSAIKQSLTEVETLLASRMDYYFN